MANMIDDKKKNNVLKLFGGLSDADLEHLRPVDRALLSKQIQDSITPEMTDDMLKKITADENYDFTAQQNGVKPTFKIGGGSDYTDRKSGITISPTADGKYRILDRDGKLDTLANNAQDAIEMAEKLSVRNVVKDQVRQKKANYVQSTAARLAKGVPVEVYNTEDDMLAANPDVAQSRNYEKGGPGFANNGTLFVILDNLDKPSDAVKVVMHEAGVHLGLNRVFSTPAELKKFTDNLGPAYKGKTEAMIKGGYSPDVAAEEALAYTWQNRKADPSGYQRIVSMLHSAVRKIFPKVPFTESDIEVVMADAQKSVMEGEGEFYHNPTRNPKTHVPASATDELPAP